MRACLKCGFTKYNKRRALCLSCEIPMALVDGPLRKVVESLTRSEYAIMSATCKTYTASEICDVEIILCFNQVYNDFVFSSLPEHFEHISDRHHPSQYTLTYVLNHPGSLTSMVIYDYFNHLSRSKPVAVVLKEAIAELYEWALDIENTAKYAVYKLGGYL